MEILILTQIKLEVTTPSRSLLKKSLNVPSLSVQIYFSHSNLIKILYYQLHYVKVLGNLLNFIMVIFIFHVF